MLSSVANVIMVSFGANVIIWCYHVMLSSGMRTHPFFIFPGNFTHSVDPLFFSPHAGLQNRKLVTSSLSAPSSQVVSLADLTPALLARLKKKDVLGGTSVYDPEQNPWQVCEVI